MCTIFNHKVSNLPFVNKMIAKRIFTNALLAFSKNGGRLTESELKQMSLEHFLCICVMNHIDIQFK